jgi:hypothetical protein
VLSSIRIPYFPTSRGVLKAPFVAVTVMERETISVAPSTIGVDAGVKVILEKLVVSAEPVAV